MKKILIIQTASLGDVILATPLAEKLHHVFPQASIDFLVKKGNEPLLKNHPFLHSTLVWDKSAGSFLHALKCIRMIRSNRYDLVVNAQRFFMTGLMTVLSMATFKTGFDKNPLSILFTSKISHRIGEGIHEIDRNLALIEEFQGPAPGIRYLPKLYPSPEDLQKTASYKTKPYYTLSPASLWFTKQFPASQWAQLISHIPANDSVYLLGAPNDHSLCEEIRLVSGHPGTVNLSGKLSLLQSASLMQDARMNFTNDSAPMHLASSVNAPVTVVYCSTIPEFGFGPLSTDSVVVEIPEKLSCRPCGLHGYPQCPQKHFRCATSIPLELLLKRL